MESIPIILSIEDISTTVKHPEGQISIHANGTISVEGSIKIAALALAKHIVRNEYDRDIVSLEINKSIRIDFQNKFELTCLLEEKPVFFDELASEFKKVVQMKAFW